MTYRALLTAAGAAWLSVYVPYAAGRTIYVDAGAAGPVHDGTSWCAAYRFLQDALAVVFSGDTVRVAKGTYRPDKGFGQAAGDRSLSFQLSSSVALEGGFAGCTAANPDERDVRQYETVLGGDLNGDDQPDFRNNGENSYHVLIAVRVGSNAVLDGFTIRGGNADGPDLSSRGGGLLNDGGQPTIRDCTFTENWGRFGGAMNNEGASPKIVNTIFLANQAGFSGGAIRGWASGPIVHNCLFKGNTAEVGGAVWFGAGAPIFRNCTFVENAASQGNAFGLDSCCPQQPSYVEAGNCILWDGSDEVANIDGSTVALSFSLVQGGFPGQGNMDEDPMFAPGPLGCHYLSQTAAGQLQNSPAVDAGDDSAASLGLDHRTTRRDEVEDAGMADIGYHFPIAGRNFVLGDWDRDAKVDLRDYAALQQCFTGLDLLDVPPCCLVFDFQSDGDVDLADAEAFAAGMTSP